MLRVKALQILPLRAAPVFVRAEEFHNGQFPRALFCLHMPTPTLGSYNSKPISSESYCYIQGDLTGLTAPILELASLDAGREEGPLSLAAEPV